MVHPGTLRAASIYPCYSFGFNLIHFITSLQIVEAVACIPGLFRCGGRQARTPFGEVRSTNESDAVASAKHGCAFSLFFQKRAGRSVHDNKIALSPSFSLSRHTHMLAHSHCHANIACACALSKIRWCFTLLFQFNFIIFIRGVAVNLPFSAMEHPAISPYYSFICAAITITLGVCAAALRATINHV